MTSYPEPTALDYVVTTIRAMLSIINLGITLWFVYRHFRSGFTLPQFFRSRYTLCVVLMGIFLVFYEALDYDAVICFSRNPADVALLDFAAILFLIFFLCAHMTVLYLHASEIIHPRILGVTKYISMFFALSMCIPLVGSAELVFSPATSASIDETGKLVFTDASTGGCKLNNRYGEFGGVFIITMSSIIHGIYYFGFIAYLHQWTWFLPRPKPQSQSQTRTNNNNANINSVKPASSNGNVTAVSAAQVKAVTARGRLKARAGLQMTGVSISLSLLFIAVAKATVPASSVFMIPFHMGLTVGLAMWIKFKLESDRNDQKEKKRMRVLALSAEALLKVASNGELEKTSPSAHGSGKNAENQTELNMDDLNLTNGLK